MSISRSPARTYEDAVKRIDALRSLDGAEVNPLAVTSFLTHGRKTERAIALLHGYTSSPRLYVKLAEAFFEQGYNVLIPRFPHHGLKDRMTTELEHLTKRELLGTTVEAVDILQGLGERVDVAGHSMGGVMALWAGQHCADLCLACAIAPALAYRAVPLRLTALVMQVLLMMPNQFWWWDEETKDAPLPPFHAYPRYSTHGLARLTKIGLGVRASSRHAVPKALSVVVVTNPADEAVNNAYADETVRRWKAAGARNVYGYEFDPDLKLKHDLIDPEQTYQRIDMVYPILIDQITRHEIQLKEEQG
jgi:alpha-beta hydrolase superfamily lysophospholipase